MVFSFLRGDNMIRTATLSATTKKQLDELLEQVKDGKLEMNKALKKAKRLRDDDWQRKQAAM
jgi:hypothetical protein